MIISKENRRTIYESLFKEGVMVAPKEFEIKHPELDIPNLQVVKACQSLTSKGFVHTQFSWQWYFYTLTDEVRFRGTDQWEICSTDILPSLLIALGPRVSPRVPSPSRRDRPRHTQATCSSCPTGRCRWSC